MKLILGFLNYLNHKLSWPASSNKHAPVNRHLSTSANINIQWHTFYILANILIRPCIGEKEN